jgi:hypothetical protein
VKYADLVVTSRFSSTIPDILRQPIGQVLDRFTAGGGRLVLIWWGSP